MAHPEIYVSADIEADGPIPGRYSMLAFGAGAYTAAGELVGTFERNLETLPGASQCPHTMQWWSTQPKAWEACRRDPQPVVESMEAFADWGRRLPGRPVLVGYPASYDFMFIYWYLLAFGLGEFPSRQDNPFGFAALDIKTLAWARMGGKFRHVSKRKMPKRWLKSEHPHDHTPLNDALGQGDLFLAAAREIVPGFGDTP